MHIDWAFFKENKEADNKSKVFKATQMTIEEEIFYQLDKYHDEPFDVVFAKQIDMAEFRKMKLVSCFSNNFYD